MTISVNWQQANNYPAAQLRNTISALVASNPNGSVRNGCLRNLQTFGFSVAGMNMTLQPGQAIIDGYLFTSDDSETVTLDVGGATSRTDLIVARVYDEESGDLNSVGTIEVVKGTTTALPPTPSRAVALFSVLVNAGAGTLLAGNVTDRRYYTSALGGALWLPGSLASTPAVPDGQLVWDPQAERLAINDGGQWLKFVDDVTAADTVNDSGWVNIPVQSGFAGTAQVPQARRISGIVYLRGAFDSTGLSASTSSQIAGILPAAFRPVQFMSMAAGTAGVSQYGVIALSTNGNVDIRTGPSLAPYYRLDGISYPTD